MKYYSEITNKSYDTEKDCLDAEEAFKAEQEKNKLSLEEKKSAISKQKKALSDKITQADDSVDVAYEALSRARKDADKIVQEAKAKANEIVKAAADDVERAVASRRDLITQFSKEFGPYTVTYTGERASREYDRMLKKIDNLFDSAYFPFFSPRLWF